MTIFEGGVFLVDLLYLVVDCGVEEKLFGLSVGGCCVGCVNGIILPEHDILLIKL